MPIRTFQYRLYPSPIQEKSLEVMLDASRNVYNMALEERKILYDIEKISVSKKDGYKLAKRYKKTFRFAKKVHSHVLQVCIEDLDEAFAAFFKRVQNHEKAGYPRFKSKKRWHSFGFKQYGNGFKIDGRRLRISGVGRIAVRWHRPYHGEIKTCRLIRKAGKWFVSLACEVPAANALPATEQAIGIDVGINALATLSDGQKVENPRWYRNAQRKLRLKQRQLARAQKGSKQRKKKVQAVQREHQHIKNQRKDFLDRLVFHLVQNYDLIVLENLQIQNMIKNKHLNKSILDAGWGYFKKRLFHKAADAGREVRLVHPAYTSKTCSNCGRLFEDLSLADRWLDCPCGLSLDRDHNAAINILKTGRSCP